MEKFGTENPILAFGIVIIAILAIESITANLMRMVASYWSRPKPHTSDPEKIQED